MLRDEAMVVRLSISQWSARKFDRNVTQKVAQDFNVSTNVGNYRKALIADDAVKAVAKVATEARDYHYTNTLPWDDVGGRLLPSKNFMAYSQKMRELRAQFESAVKTFLDNYEGLRDEARTRLKGMFNPADYPSKTDIVRRYGFSTDIEPVPVADDFRVRLQDDDAARIRKEIEQTVQDRASKAMGDLYERLAETVGHFAEKLSDTDSIFRDSLVENVIELVDLLPRLNVANDKRLNDLRKEVKEKLCGFEPSTLRNEPVARAQAAKDAKDILKKMSAYTGK